MSDFSNNPEFVVFLGPMFGGKTTRLLSALERYRYQNRKIFTFKPKIDDRYHKAKIMTHNGLEELAITVNNALEIKDFLKEVVDISLEKPVIAVDEAFMLEHSGKILPELFFMGATIIVSTLQLSHAGLPFHEVSQFICYATKVEISPAVCPLCGKDAYFTSKISGERNQNIDIGGSDKYQPRCFEHYQPDSFNSTI